MRDESGMWTQWCPMSLILRNLPILKWFRPQNIRPNTELQTPQRAKKLTLNFRNTMRANLKSRKSTCGVGRPAEKWPWQIWHHTQWVSQRDISTGRAYSWDAKHKGKTNRLNHAYRPSTKEAEVGGSQGVWGQHCQFQVSLGNRVRSCFKQQLLNKRISIFKTSSLEEDTKTGILNSQSKAGKSFDF